MNIHEWIRHCSSAEWTSKGLELSSHAERYSNVWMLIWNRWLALRYDCQVWIWQAWDDQCWLDFWHKDLGLSHWLINEKKLAVNRSPKPSNSCETHYTHFQAFIVLSFKDLSTPFRVNENFSTMTLEFCEPPLSCLFSGTCGYVPSLLSWRQGNNLHFFIYTENWISGLDLVELKMCLRRKIGS